MFQSNQKKKKSKRQYKHLFKAFRRRHVESGYWERLKSVSVDVLRLDTFDENATGAAGLLAAIAMILILRFFYRGRKNQETTILLSMKEQQVSMANNTYSCVVGKRVDKQGVVPSLHPILSSSSEEEHQLPNEEESCFQAEPFYRDVVFPSTEAALSTGHEAIEQQLPYIYAAKEEKTKLASPDHEELCYDFDPIEPEDIFATIRASLSTPGHETTKRHPLQISAAKDESELLATPYQQEINEQVFDPLPRASFSTGYEAINDNRPKVNVLKKGQTQQESPKVLDPACYLVYEPDSSGRLVELYSKTPIQNAIGRWVPTGTKKIANFKFTQNLGKTILIGNCAAGVNGRKNYFGGWCQFIKSARINDAEVTLWDPSGKGLKVDVWLYTTDYRPGRQSIKLEEGVPTNVANILAVAALPKHTPFYSGMTVDLLKWLQDGTRHGKSSKIDQK